MYSYSRRCPLIDPLVIDIGGKSLFLHYPKLTSSIPGGRRDYGTETLQWRGCIAEEL